MTDRPHPSTQQVSEWLTRFRAALDRNDLAAAADQFDDECYWRDLISFTWNIKTLEGKDDIQAMLAATLSNTRPSHWQIKGEAAEENGVTSGWFTFETARTRGKGYLRLRAGKCWTLLTTMTELKGLKKKRARSAPAVCSTASSEIEKPGLTSELKKKPNWVIQRSPTASLSAGDKGASPSRLG